MGVMRGDGQRRLGGKAMEVRGGNVRGTCGVGMRSKEYCARMSAEPLMQRGAATLGSDTQGQTPRQRPEQGHNNNILVATTLPQPLLFSFQFSTCKCCLLLSYNNWRCYRLASAYSYVSRDPLCDDLGLS
jgi:hypothetical protein